MRGVQTKTAYFPFGGGLDLVSPALAVKPGALLACVNFEPWFSGGYRRIQGYERYDGRAKPSDATFSALTLDTVTGFAVGDSVHNQVGVTGQVVGVDTTNLIVGVTLVTGGSFAIDDTITDALAGTHTVTTDPVDKGAIDQDTEDAWMRVARGVYRDLIGEVPGVGMPRGVWRRDGKIYAWRDDADPATQSVMYKASAAGWTTAGITMSHYMYFSGGGGGTAHALPAEGDTITGNSSGASATAHRVVTHGGTTAGNDAFGFFALTNVVGVFTNGEDLKISGTKFAVAASGSQVFTFAPGGVFRFDNYNFFGGSATYRTYGVNGVGPAFEIDENDVVSPIIFPISPVTGQPEANLPFLIEPHQGYLFLGFPGGNFAHSVVGEPMQFSGFLGAAEFGAGAELTGLNSSVGPVLIISTQHNTQALYGTDPTTWDLQVIGERAGACHNSAVKFDAVYGLNEIGITKFTRTLSFGNFAGVTISQLVQPIVEAMHDRAVDASVIRSSSQYRIYFDDGSFLIVFIPLAGQANLPSVDNSPQTDAKVAFGYGQYPDIVRQHYTVIDENGVETAYFCTDDGYIRQDRIGTSFDGETIPAYARLAFNHIGSPAYRKFFRRADLECQANRRLQISFVADLTYGSQEISSIVEDITPSNVPVVDIYAGGGFFDVSNWDQFYWDGQNISTARADLSGTGENIGFLIFNESDVADPFVIEGIVIHYEPRRLQR